jgi:hypothetical protein
MAFRILACTKEKAIGTKLISPIKSIKFLQVASGFVDNTTHWNIDITRSLSEGDTGEIINNKATRAA